MIRMMRTTRRSLLLALAFETMIMRIGACKSVS
jgi:hypothetical protein